MPKPEAPIPPRKRGTPAGMLAGKVVIPKRQRTGAVHDVAEFAKATENVPLEEACIKV